jgi:Flp pilus assembly protein CpaB
VVGGFLVAVAAVVVFAAALSAAGGHERSFVVAARSLPAGTIIGPGDTATQRFGLTGAAGAAAFGDPSALEGRSLTVAVQPGELIEAPMLAGPSGSDLRPVSIPVDSDSLAALTAGESVDVLAVSSPSSAQSAPSASAPPGVTVVMRGATLLSVSTSATGLLSGNSGGTIVVTLGVADLPEAEQLVLAAHTTTVELVQAVPSDGHGAGDSSSGTGG